MKTEEKQRHREILEPLSDREILVQVSLGLAEINDTMVTRKEYNAFKAIVKWGATTALTVAGAIGMVWMKK